MYIRTPVPVACMRPAKGANRSRAGGVPLRRPRKLPSRRALQSDNPDATPFSRTPRVFPDVISTSYSHPLRSPALPPTRIDLSIYHGRGPRTGRDVEIRISRAAVTGLCARDSGPREHVERRDWPGVRRRRSGSLAPRSSLAARDALPFYFKASARLFPWRVF